MEQNTQPRDNSIEIKLDNEGKPINSNSKKPLSQKTIVFILAVIQAVVVGSVYFTFLSKEDNNNN
ncbi:hypothetical protein K0B03_04200, partial [Patescibacteria group bacterium]|nr:hypothetical protein [Patescibacteria group bacterium]